MLEFCGNGITLEKASVDEAYLDLTKEVERILVNDEEFKRIVEEPDVGFVFLLNLLFCLRRRGSKSCFLRRIQLTPTRISRRLIELNV